jgi:hypothetical protein
MSTVLPPQTYSLKLPGCEKKITRNVTFEWNLYWMPKQPEDVFECESGRMVIFLPGIQNSTCKSRGCDGCPSYKPSKER